MECKYIVLQYYKQINDIEEIISLIKKGILVHIFTNEGENEALEKIKKFSGFLEEAVNNRFINIYSIYEELRNDETIAVDDKILNKNFYDKVCCDKNIGFNFQQYEIITAQKDNNYIVVSGAGTGKTTTMINRLIYLRMKYDEFDFSKVVLITFTNKASISMRDKLLSTLDMYYRVTKDNRYLNIMDETSSAIISTIHGFAKRLINENGENINVNKDATVKSFKYQREQAVTIGLDYLYKEYKNLYNVIKYYPLYQVKKRMLDIWEKLDNYSIDLNNPNYTVDFGSDDKDFNKIIEIVLVKAQKYLDQNKDYEFEISDLMKKLAYKDLLVKVKNKYDLVMVDEFQDSDNIQIDFIANFCNITGAKLIVVGDEKQSIYRFRGAEHTAFYKIKNALSKYNKSYKQFSMVRNYRTDASLLADINQCFINIGKKVDKFNYDEESQIYSLVNKDKNTEIDLIELPKEDIRAVGDFYENILIDKEKGEYAAVLFRSNEELKDFKRFCDMESIPCRIDVSGQFYRHQSVRDFYIMIKSLTNYDQNEIAYSLITSPYIKDNIDKNVILSDGTNEVHKYLQRILSKNHWSDFTNLADNMDSLELLDKIIYETKPVNNYYRSEFYKAKNNGRNAKRVAYAKALEYKINLEYLLYILKDKFSDNLSSIAAIESFLKNKIATDNEIDVRRLADINRDDKDNEVISESDFLQCSTVHKSKGLEYDYVIIPKMTHSFISRSNSEVIIRNNNNKIIVGFKVTFGDVEYKNSYYSDYLRNEKSEIIGEETRLLYVAMTRCKKRLYLNAGGVAATEGQNNWKSLIGGARSYV